MKRVIEIERIDSDIKTMHEIENGWIVDVKVGLDMRLVLTSEYEVLR